YAVQRMTVELGDYAKGIRGYVRVAASTSAMMQFLPEDLRDFLQRNPSIRIDLQQRASMDAARFVQDGVADIGIFSSAIPAAELQAFPYRTDTLVVIVPENHPLTQRKAVRFRELLQYDFIELEEGSAIHALLTREAALLGKYLKVRVRVRSFDVLCRMIQNGIGVGVLPEASAAMYMAAMELRKVRLDESWAHREVQLYVRNTDALTPSARQLLQFLSRSASPGIEGSERMDSADSDGTETAPTAGSAQRKR
ncbi:MAG TPA: LysR substrate-binding domain-containing protein, partial [Pyrinomonadaceae bacterium]|nr:LysR substrate-binding domain-containing protein [Pyrinomonadaceae bacterium]